MQRIPAMTIENAPEKCKPIMEAIKGKYGKVPNFFASVANSPAALKMTMGMFGALDEGEFAGKAHEAIAVRVGEMNGCTYGTAAHTAKAKMAGASVEDTIAWRKGEASDPTIKALLDFASAVVEKRGRISEADVQAARDAGLTDAQLVEALAITVLNNFTNAVNALVQTDLDFPAAPEIG